MEFVLSVFAAIALTPIAFSAGLKLLIALNKSKSSSLKPPISTSVAPAKTSIPVVLVDVDPATGKHLAAHLMPEYEVVLELQSFSRAKEELCSIMERQKPGTDGDIVGNHDFSRLPKHVIFGKRYHEHKVQEVRKALGGERSGISWYWTPSLPGEKLSSPDNIDEEQLDVCARRLARHIKNTMNAVVEDGKEGLDGLYEL